MNRWWRSYFTYSSMERRGIALLLLLILAGLVMLAGIRYWLRPEHETPDPALAEAYLKYRTTHPATGQTGDPDREPPLKGELFHFDPNSLDSNGFIRLGLRPRTVRMLLNWRRKGKIFYEKQDFRPLYTLREEDYKRLEPYITIIRAAPDRHKYPAFYRQEPLPATIDLNRTDSATLVRLNGIGPVLAHKIIGKRKALGGFIRHEQLNEVYRFPDSIYKMLREKLIIDPGAVHRLNLNTANLDELRSHPYIGEKTGRNILTLREGLKRFDNIEQLRQVPLMNEENYRKIAPYFVLE